VGGGFSGRPHRRLFLADFANETCLGPELSPGPARLAASLHKHQGSLTSLVSVRGIIENEITPISGH
jgi:hypothetical protein